MDLKTLKIRELNKLEIIKIYLKHLRYDFPRNERRPLWLILKGLKEGYYECIGCFDNKSNVVGYLFLIEHEGNYLVDYLAIVKSLRGQGIGSAFLQKIGIYNTDAKSILLEVEDPEYATYKEEKELRERRIRFYSRNGYVDTSVRTITFGVNFIILKNQSLDIECDRVRELYPAMYRKSLNEMLFKNNIIVL